MARSADRPTVARPGLSQARELVVALDQRGGPRLLAGPGSHPTHPEVGERLVDALDDLRLARLDLEAVRDEPADLFGDHHRAGLREGLEARADVGRQAVDVLLVEVEVHGTVVDADADVERLARAPLP